MSKYFIFIFLCLSCSDLNLNNTPPKENAPVSGSEGADTINRQPERSEDLYPLRTYFKSGLANSPQAFATLNMIAQQFASFEGAFPIGSETAFRIEDLGPVHNIPARDTKFLYLIPITSYETNQTGVGVRVETVDHDESAFVHAADPGLLTFSEGAGSQLRVSWRRDGRQLGNTKYVVYRKIPSSHDYIKLMEVPDTGLNVYFFTDARYTNESVCYKINSFSEQHQQEVYFTHPRCTIPGVPFESPVVSSQITHTRVRNDANHTLDDESYRVEFWARKESAYQIAVKSRPLGDCGAALPTCFEERSFPARRIAIWGDLYAYEVTIKRSDLIKPPKLSALDSPLFVSTRSYREYRHPVFEIRNNGTKIFPTRGEVMTVQVNNRIRDRYWLGYYMNPQSYTWRNALAQFARNAEQLGYGGLFLDEVRPYRLSLFSPLGVNSEAAAVEFPDPPNFQHTADDKHDVWGAALKGLTQNLKQQVPTMKLMGNTLKAVHPDETNAYGPPAILQQRIDSIASTMDGVMFENAFHNSARLVLGDKWDREVLKIEEHLHLGRDVIAFMTPDENSLAHFFTKLDLRFFLAATAYLIGEGPGRFYAGVPEVLPSSVPEFSNGRNNVTPEFRIPLGRPQGQRAYMSKQGFAYFARAFSNGFVFLNARKPTAYVSSSDFGLANWEGFARVSIVDAHVETRHPGRLSFQSIQGSQIVIEEARAAIILRAPPAR